jgi:putative chitinase
LADDPDIAARLLAAFLADNETQIREVLQINNLDEARELVNGGTHGLLDFKDAFQRGQGQVPDPVQFRQITIESGGLNNVGDYLF